MDEGGTCVERHNGLKLRHRTPYSARLLRMAAKKLGDLEESTVGLQEKTKRLSQKPRRGDST